MTPEAWTFAGGCVAVVGGIVVEGIRTRAKIGRTERKVDTAAKVARTAADNTTNVANGFADKTTNGIDQILAGQERLQRTVERLADISGRTVARLDRVAARVDGHLDDHLHGVLKDKDGET